MSKKKFKIVVTALLLVITLELVMISNTIVNDKKSYALPNQETETEEVISSIVLDKIPEEIITTTDNINTTTSVTTVIESSKATTTSRNSTTTSKSNTTTKTTTKKETTTSKKTTNSNYATTAELKLEAVEYMNSNRASINEILKYMNEYRGEKGVGSISLDENLTLAATIRALEIAKYDKFSHTRPNGSDWYTVTLELGFGYPSAENIAKGQTTPKAVSTAWKNSSGHYANIINKDNKRIGIGVVKYNGRYYWVQLFGR